MSNRTLAPIALLLIWVFSFLLAGCEKLAVSNAPSKKPVVSNTAYAKQAEENFWQVLHQGKYDQIDAAARQLTAAYIMNPNDPKLAAHLGFLYIWKISERQRQPQLDPLIVNQIILAKKYFKESMELNPEDARILGFYGVTQVVEGKIFNDQREQVRGYFTLRQAIKEWPQFNYFTAGYPMSSLPAKDKHFKEALEWQWRTLNICAKDKINRQNPDFSPYMHLKTTKGKERACWNSWIAPFNFEGFFLNMGDMLVKSGDWQTAIKIYQNAKLADNYNQWPYKNILEKSIETAQRNVALFNQTAPLTEKSPEPAIMFNSRFSCMACHQQGEKVVEKPKSKKKV